MEMQFVGGIRDDANRDVVAFADGEYGGTLRAAALSHDDVKHLRKSRRPDGPHRYGMSARRECRGGAKKKDTTEQ